MGKEETVTASVRVGLEFLAAVDAAKPSGMSRSYVLRRCMEIGWELVRENRALLVAEASRATPEPAQRPTKKGAKP